jgi:hypothetical protein
MRCESSALVEEEEVSKYGKEKREEKKDGRGEIGRVPITVAHLVVNILMVFDLLIEPISISADISLHIPSAFLLKP